MEVRKIRKLNSAQARALEMVRPLVDPRARRGQRPGATLGESPRVVSGRSYEHGSIEIPRLGLRVDK